MLRLLIALLGISGLGLLGLARLLRREKPHYPSPDTLITEPDVDLSAVRTNSDSYRLAWHGSARIARVYTSTEPDSFEHATPAAQVTEQNSVILTGLAPNKRHYFEIHFDGAALDGSRLVAAERIIPLEGAANFRDIGGYATADGRHTRWGRVYRSGALNGLTTADQAYLRELGIRLVCDLRNPDEVRDDPDALPTNAQIDYAHLPVQTELDTSRMRQLRVLLFNQQEMPELLRYTYKKVMIDGNAELFGAIFRRLAQANNLPTIIHCTAGKDRAGLAAALLLSALGVADEIVIADYTLSNYAFTSFRKYAAKVVKPFAFFGITGDDLYPLLIADAQNLKDTLAYLRQNHGSVRDYLNNMAGIDESIMVQLEANLLE